MNKLIYYILYIDTFEEQCVLIEGMLESPRLVDNMKTIGIYQSLCNRSSFEQKCLNNIKKIYQHADKCDDQQNLKDINYDYMVYTTEEFTDDSPSLNMTLTTVKKPSARRSLCLFTNIFDVKKKTEKRCVGDAKSKRRAIKFGNSLWTNKTKRKGHSKINDQIKLNIYAWLTRNTQVVQSPTSNGCLKVMFDDQTEPQLVPELLI